MGHEDKGRMICMLMGIPDPVILNLMSCIEQHAPGWDKLNGSVYGCMNYDILLHLSHLLYLVCALLLARP